MNPRVAALVDKNGAYVIGIVDPETLERGVYVTDFDPDLTAWGAYAAGPLAQALRFRSAAEAMMCWRLQSKTVPLRPDGKPNRPLTALTVEITKAKPDA